VQLLQRLKRDLVECVRTSECYKQGYPWGECFRKKDELPFDCQQLIQTYYYCKRGQIDMRNRLKGNIYGIPKEKTDSSKET